jgi:hypothetical protein
LVLRKGIATSGVFVLRNGLIWWDQQPSKSRRGRSVATGAIETGGQSKGEAFRADFARSTHI